MRAIRCLAGGRVSEPYSKRKALTMALRCLTETLGGALGLRRWRRLRQSLQNDLRDKICFQLPVPRTTGLSQHPEGHARHEA